MTEAAFTRARLAVFAALAAFTAANWMTLVEHPPVGRTILAIGIAIAGAAALAAIAARGPGHWRAPALASMTVLALVLAAALALGLPARLLLPAGWSELSHEVSHGVGTLGGADYPYEGGDTWSRLVLLLAVAPLLALAAALWFWPSRGAGRWRQRAGLLVLLVGFGVAVTVSGPPDPLVRGALLLALIGAWIWVPAPGRRRAATAAALLAAAALVAVPIASGLDGSRPWVDYHRWNWSGTPFDSTESFDWNQTFGPLDWSRDGRTLVEVHSTDPHYWATEILDQFNGQTWVGTTAPGNVDLPLRAHGPGPAPLDPEWVFRAVVDDRALSSQFMVGAGSVISVAGLDRVTKTAEGVLVGGALGEGKSYAFTAYDPQPLPSQMRAAGGSYPTQLQRYTTVDVPRLGTIPTKVHLHEIPVALTLNPVSVPLRSTAPEPVLPGLSRSPYSQVYALARRLAAGRGSAFDVARSVQSYLRSHYTYSESPPSRFFPLRAFLFRDKVGYCQQFSGSMALLLRMDGIPSRVVGGFAPGRATGHGFAISDFDAHSWVQVYFNGIGWVNFDPTPTSAPAVSRSSKLAASGPRPTGLQFKAPLGVHGGHGGAGALALRSRGGGSFPWGWVAIVALGSAAAAALLALRRSIRRRRALSSAELAEAQAFELRAALSRVGRPLAAGATLRAIERRLRDLGGPRVASYAARLQSCRYGPAGEPPPSTRERRAIRRALGSGAGIRGRARAWLLIPPGGPRERRRQS